MSELPRGWDLLKLRDVATLKTGPFGSALHKADYIVGGIPLINPTHIKQGKLSPALEVTVSPETAHRLSEYRLTKGDIVMGRRGEMGRCAVVPEHAQNWLCGTGSVVVKSTLAAHPQYLQKFLTAPATVAALIGDSVGSTMINLNQGVLLDLDIPLAPLPEQKRIADKLDSVLARVDACRDRLDRLPALLKRFRQSILAAATSGRLTEDWRGKVDLSNWAKVSVKEVCHSVSDGDHQAPPQATSGIPFITISAFNTGRLELHKASRFVPKEYFDSLSSIRRPARGDILYSVTGSIGIAALVNVDTEFTFQRHVAILKPDHARVSSAYLLHLLSSEMIKEQAQLIATGTAQLTIPLNGLRAFVINLPPLLEQTEIVRRVEILFAFADRLEARLATARRQVGQLTPALLAKAFRGELVAQDPADEPAAELLKRLAALHEAAPKVKRGRVRG
jgi:type I restriction enzyme S subunit